MYMTFLEIFFIISGAIIFILWIDIAKKQRFNALHFLVFIWMGVGLLVFTFFPQVLKEIGDLFGVARGADALVYISVVFLFYFVLLLLTKHVENKEDLTKLIRELAIDQSDKRNIQGKDVFIIPAYNEGTVLKETINNILNHNYKNIIVINDGSGDNTRKILSFFWDKIISLHHLKNRWQWAALETGFEYVRRFADVDYVITFDADGQHSLDDLQEFEKRLKKYPDIDVLLGSRFLSKKTVGIPFSRKLILKLGVLFTFFISQINLTDTHNGFRVMRKKVLKDIKVTIDGMWHASEILDIIAAKKITFQEVPVNIIYSDYSLKKWQSSGNAIAIALRIIWNKFFK